MFNLINMYFIDPLLAGCTGVLAKLAGMVVPLVVGWLAMRPQGVPLWPFQWPRREPPQVGVAEVRPEVHPMWHMLVVKEHRGAVSAAFTWAGGMA
ncbi:hypothetical protein QBC45DRAFT_394580 [Copromyces sp. CBS 386.78]|nr:hypothetical protein QBC45DRAFT_394580 [Copromyces sp. CBS 386.78]